MLNPPIFSIIESNAACTDILGTGPVRFFPFGKAPQGVAKPYAVYTVFNANPENYLSGAPDIDNKGTQVDLYAENAEDLRNLFEAIKNAIELKAHMTSFSTPVPDAETALWTARMEFDFWDAR